MYVKKYKGKVYGAEFTTDEQKAIDIEISKQLRETVDTFMRDMDAVILYTLLASEGWKQKRLRAFWENVYKEREKLLQHYECSSDDYVWLARYKLKEIGVNVDEWNDEITNSEMRVTS